MQHRSVVGVQHRNIIKCGSDGGALVSLTGPVHTEEIHAPRKIAHHADIDLDGDWDIYISDILYTTLDAEPLGNALYIRGAGRIGGPSGGLTAYTSKTSLSV